MSFRKMSHSCFLCFMLVIAVIVIDACSSRYRFDLYMSTEGNRRKIKVEQTQFIMDANLGNPHADDKVVIGHGNVAVVTIGTRGKRTSDIPTGVFGFDEYLRCQIYLQLPDMPKPDTIDLQDNSFIHLLGRFDWSADDKIFLPDSGFFIIDSVTTSNIFVTINGRYENPSGYTFAFDGRVKTGIAPGLSRTQ